jgi:hypothetical protein
VREELVRDISRAALKRGRSAVETHVATSLQEVTAPTVCVGRLMVIVDVGMVWYAHEDVVEVMVAKIPLMVPLVQTHQADGIAAGEPSKRTPSEFSKQLGGAELGRFASAEAMMAAWSSPKDVSK